TYDLMLGDVNTTLTCVVTATDTASTDSPASAGQLIHSAIPHSTGDAVLSPSVVHGRDIASCSAPFDDPTPPDAFAYSYIWKVNGVDQMVNTSTFTVPPSAEGLQLKCSVTATNGTVPSASSTTSPDSPAQVVQQQLPTVSYSRFGHVVSGTVEPGAGQ